MLPAVLLLLTVFLSGSHQQCFRDDDTTSSLQPEYMKLWTDYGHSFSVAMFKELDKERSEPTENAVFSPWSIQQVLLLAYFGAEGETEDSIAKVLHIPPYWFKPLSWIYFNDERELNRRNNVTNYPFKSANKLYLPNIVILRGCIEDKLLNELELIDFYSDSKLAQKYINEWISSQTDGQITDLIKDLSPFSKGTIVSAASYKGDWLTKFDPTKTEDTTFYPSFNIFSRVEMMVKEDYYKHGYVEAIGARTLLLPYADNRTAMIVLLPDRDLDRMMDALDGESLRYITSTNTYETAFFKLQIPKFKHKTSKNLNQAMNRLGIGDAFSFGDFSGFTGRTEVRFEGMEHEAVIEVDESGAMASTLTQFYASTPATSHLDFTCNRPFAYFIYDFLLNKVLFMGTFRRPRDD